MVFLLGGTRRERPAVYRLASPVQHVTRDDPPVFFFHGEDDVLVPRPGVERMARQLTDAGVKAETLILPGKGHITAFLDSSAPDRMVEFLDRVLKDSHP
jgi:dipeptidyl aminopeptidase/acylaminoacyl peptidase